MGDAGTVASMDLDGDGLKSRPKVDWITISVERSLDPFKHKQKEMRDLCATHENSEFFWNKDHESKISKFQKFLSLGPHPLLAHQTGTPKRWIKVRLEVKGRESDWIILVMREDNLYVRGFTNKHGSYELVPERPKPVIQGSKGDGLQPLFASEMFDNNDFQLLEWDIKYNKLFEVSDPEELGELLDNMASNQDLVVDAVTLLSEYKHKKGPQIDRAEELSTRRHLAGLIFKFCEWLRMDMDRSFMAVVKGGWILPTGLQKARIWGELCQELLKWRARGFKKWITDDPARKDTYWAERFREAGILNEKRALELVCLVLNRNCEHYKNLEANKPNPNKQKGPRPEDPGEKSGEKSDDEVQEGEPSDDEGEGEPSDGKGPVRGDGSGQLSRRLQLLEIASSFSLDGVNLYDCKRGQPIFRRQSFGNQVVGPARAISTYGGTLKLDIFPTGVKGKKRKRNSLPIEILCNIHDDEDVDMDVPTIFRRKFTGKFLGERPDENICIRYLVIPNAVQATVEVFLTPEHNYVYKDYNLRSGIRGGGCYVTGSIQALIKTSFQSSGKSVDIWTTERKGYWGPIQALIKTSDKSSGESVDLFTTEKKGLWGRCGEEIRLPMMSVLCLPSKHVEISGSLMLKPILGEEEKIGPWCVKFDSRTRHQHLKFKGISVDVFVRFAE